MPMFFVHNASVNSHTGNLTADPYTEQVFNELGGSCGCYAGDESARSGKARAASKVADNASDLADRGGNRRDAVQAHTEAARVHADAASKHGSDVAASQHRAAAQEHLESALKYATSNPQQDDDGMTANYNGALTLNGCGCGREGFAENMPGVAPSLTDYIVNAARRKQLRGKLETFGKDGGDPQPDQGAPAALGFADRTGAMGTRGRDVDDRQAMGGGPGIAAGGYEADAALYVGDRNGIARQAAEARRGNATYDKKSLLDPDGEGIGNGPALTDYKMPNDGRSLWADDQQGSASYPDSSHDMDLDSAGWIVGQSKGAVEMAAEEAAQRMAERTKRIRGE